MLQCELFEGYGFPAGGNVYLLLAWGSTERKSPSVPQRDGMVVFESDQRDNYYNLIEPIRAELPPDTETHYDVFVHVYVETITGHRRVAYKRYQTKSLQASAGWDTGPQWTLMSADPEAKGELAVSGSMLLLSLRFGMKKDLAATPQGLKLTNTKIPKMKGYELRANLFLAQGLTPADENGLADPYVRVSLRGASAVSQVVNETLSPIWYQQLRLKCELPGDLALAPKVTLVVYDSDPALGLVSSAALDPVIGTALAPGRDAATPSVHAYYSRDIGKANQNGPPREWIDLYDPDAVDALALKAAGSDVSELPPTVGRLLASFELKPLQEAMKEEKRAKEKESGGAMMSAMLTRSAGMEYKMPQRELPAFLSCWVEVCVVGVRDLQSGPLGSITAPFVEFEYGCTGKPREERVWRTRAAGAGGTNATGPNANLLDVVYCKVELPADPAFEPIMGVRVRDTNKARSLLGKFGAAMAHPIVGVTNINLTKLVPTYQRIAAEREAMREEAEAEEARRRQAEEEEARRATEDQVLLARPPNPEAKNEEELDELVLRSTAREKRDTRAKQMARSGGALDRVGVRTLPAPDEVALTIDEASSEEDDEYEGAAAVAPGQRTLDRELELELDDIPFHMQRLHIGSEKPTFQLGAIKFGQRRFAGLIKLQARVIERGDEDDLRNFVQQSPPPNLRKLYAEKQYRVRLHVYSAVNLTPRSSSDPPQPFLKVFNGEDQLQRKSTADKPVGRDARPRLLPLVRAAGAAARPESAPRAGVGLQRVGGKDDRRDGDRPRGPAVLQDVARDAAEGRDPERDARAECAGLDARDAGRDRPQGRDFGAEGGAGEPDGRARIAAEGPVRAAHHHLGGAGRRREGHAHEAVRRLRDGAAARLGGRRLRL